MEALLTKKTVSLDDVHSSADLLLRFGDDPVALMDHDGIVGYFIPRSAVHSKMFDYAEPKDVHCLLKGSVDQNQDILEYLQCR